MGMPENTDLPHQSFGISIIISLKRCIVEQEEGKQGLVVSGLDCRAATLCRRAVGMGMPTYGWQNRETGGLARPHATSQRTKRQAWNCRAATLCRRAVGMGMPTYDWQNRETGGLARPCPLRGRATARFY